MRSEIILLILLGSSLVSSFTTKPCSQQLLNREQSVLPTSTTKRCATKTATFGMGCFWKPSEKLLKVDGVVDTVVGYTGRSVEKYPNEEPPSYESVCFGRDWIEAVRVTYDDEQVSYNSLLNNFFEMQEPQFNSRQYGSVIFPGNVEEEKEAKGWIVTNQDKVRDDGIPVAITTIETPSPFYMAEEYHQRYWQKTRPRLAFLIGLIAISSGALDNFAASAVGPAIINTLHTGSSALSLLAMGYVLVERKINTKTVEL